MISSARNPNESYADRAKKAGTSSTTRATQQNHQPPATHVLSTHPPSSLKPPQVNVWAERIKEQRAHVASQPAQMSRQRAASLSQPPRDDAIQPRSPPPDLSAQLAILDQQDDHDPFVVRVPSHLSRRSSSSTNPVTDLNAWPLPGTAPRSNTSSADHETPFASAPPSRQNSTASVRHHAYSSSSSVRLSRVQSFPHHSRSASQSRAQSRSGSSASSPRLQIRGRTLPQDDSVLQDFRLDGQHRRSSNKRSSPALPDPPNHTSSSFQIDPTPADPSYYRRPPVPPLQDMPPRHAHNFIPQYTLPPHFTPTHLPGHASPPYIPHSGQGTPPYPHCPPYPTYMYRHGHPLFWGDIPQHMHTFNHFQNQPSAPLNHANTFEHVVPHKMEFGTISPLITTEPGASKPPAQFQNGSQLKSSKNVVFGTINPAESQDELNVPPSEQRADDTIEHAAEQFAAFSIGVSPNEPGPSRNASRKPSVKSLSRTPSSQPITGDGATDADIASSSSREANGTREPIKWEFGTTLSEDLNNMQPPSPPSQTSVSALTQNCQSKPTDDDPDPRIVPPSNDGSPANRSMDKSETESTTSDVWVVKDYGYGFGNHSGYGNTPDVVRWEMRQRDKDQEKGHVREGHREREVLRDHHRDRSWMPPRQLGRRHENGVEEGREGWEQQAHIDAPRHMRPRRGSLSGYGGHDRGGFSRRGRGFTGRFHGGRGRVGFFHHQRSYSYAPPPQHPASLPFEVLPPTIDMVNGYSSYAPPELESYETVPPTPQQHMSFTPATYSVDAMRNCLLEQLEYYLSSQNMAQDFYLRQRMDSQGWIPISLLASFKRVQQLHTDSDVVKEVLSRSATVEVSGDWVRMGGRQWEVFVLPNAPRSAVTEGDDPGGEGVGYSELGETEEDRGETEGDCDGEECEGDDEDDDIEFVIGEEAEGSWMPVPERK